MRCCGRLLGVKIGSKLMCLGVFVCIINYFSIRVRVFFSESEAERPKLLVALPTCKAQKGEWGDKSEGSLGVAENPFHDLMLI